MRDDCWVAETMGSPVLRAVRGSGHRVPTGGDRARNLAGWARGVNGGARAVATVGAVFVCVGLASRTAHAWCRTTTSSAPDVATGCTLGAPLAWAGRCTSRTVDATVLPNFLSEDGWRTLVRTSTDVWSGAMCSPGTPSITVLATADCARGGGYSVDGPNANVVRFRDTWPSDATHRPGAVAVTVVTFDNSTAQILDVDSELNLRTGGNPGGFDFVSSNPDGQRVDLESILLHESGHALGLAHSLDPSAVMEATSGIRAINRSLWPDDRSAICSAYPAGHAAVCDPVPRGGFACAPGCQCHGVGRPRNRETGERSIAAALFALMLATCRPRRAAPESQPLDLPHGSPGSRSSRMRQRPTLSASRRSRRHPAHTKTFVAPATPSDATASTVAWHVEHVARTDGSSLDSSPRTIPRP